MSFDDALFTFDETPWQRVQDSLKRGDTISAAAFLTLMEGESEQTLEDAFQTLADLEVTLDLRSLPKTPGTGEAAARLHLEEQWAMQEDLSAGLEPEDPLRLYLQEVTAIPACDDIGALAGELAQDSCDENRRAELCSTLANLSLSRVVELSREYVGWGVLLLDLIQEGNLGLWQSLQHYRSGDFKAYRDWWIRQSMGKAVIVQARANGVGQKIRQAAEDYRGVDERLLAELGRNPTIEEIAEGLHLPPEEAAAVAKMMENARTVEKAVAPQETEAEAEEENQAVEDTAYFQSRQRIGEMLSCLDETDAKLLTLRFGLEGGLPLSPESTARKLGLTSQEVIARETAALAKLRSEG